MSIQKLRLAIISDLHYRHHESGLDCRSAVAVQGAHADPMPALLEIIKTGDSSNEEIKCDYLLCPGDITDRAGVEPFNQAWEHLKKLKTALGAKHLIASTGNHEVDSRANPALDTPGSVIFEADPLKVLHQHSDYPSSTFIGNERRWIYWGRGYDFIEEPGVLFLLINSSHYHWTMRAAEYEKGRIGDVALDLLRVEIESRVSGDFNRAFVVLLHHHPIPHEDLDVDLGKIEMGNGSRLIQVLEESGVTWIIVHGHKHHARLISAQGSNARPIVFAAGSFGARLGGVLATRTRTQFYILNLEILDQSLGAKAIGTIDSWSWSGSSWSRSTHINDGLPDGCGFRVPELDIASLAAKLGRHLTDCDQSFLEWTEALSIFPELKSLMPSQIKQLKKTLPKLNINTTWSDNDWFPKEVAHEPK